MRFRARKKVERSEVGEVWGFLQSNVESRTEDGSCVNIIYYRIRTQMILANTMESRSLESSF